jgi:hypothetical protein
MPIAVRGGRRGTVATMAKSGARRRPQRVLFVGVTLLIAINFLILAGRNHPDQKTALPEHVQQVIPGPQEVIRPQDSVGAQLDSGFQGQLSINGAVVPDDQITGDPNLGIVTFHPGCDGSHGNVPANQCGMKTLPIGTINLRIDYWPQGQSIETARQKNTLMTYAWQAKVG